MDTPPRRFFTPALHPEQYAALSPNYPSELNNHAHIYGRRLGWHLRNRTPHCESSSHAMHADAESRRRAAVRKRYLHLIAQQCWYAASASFFCRSLHCADQGTQGRLLCWHPCGEQQTKRRKVLLASHPDLSCRFVKETSLGKTALMADVDHLDVVPRAESLNAVPGQPVMLQLGVVPAYALTVCYLASLCDTRVMQLLRPPPSHGCLITPRFIRPKLSR